MNIKKYLYENNKENLYYLIALAVIVSIASAIRILFIEMPIRHDEVVTLLDYAQKPLSVGLLENFSVNNHPFYTFLLHISFVLFGNNLWAIRLPEVIFGILIVPMAYITARTYYNKNVAIISAGIISIYPLLVEFSVNARGYSVICFLFLAMLAIIRYLKDQNNIVLWILFALLSSLGFFTIPIFLYPFGIAVVWIIISILLKDIKLNKIFLIKKLILFIIITTILTLLLYTGIFIKSGVSWVFNDPYATSTRTLQSFISLFPASIHSTWQQWNNKVPLYLTIILLIGFITSQIFHRRIANHKTPLIVSVVTFFTPLLLLQRVIPYERVWLFLLPLYLILSSSGLYFLINLILLKTNKKMIIKKVFIIFIILSILISLISGIEIIRTESIYYSKIEGNFKDAEEITKMFKEQIKPGDLILSRAPSDQILRYYFISYNIPEYYLHPNLDSYNRVFIVVHKFANQTIEGVLNYHSFDFEDYTEPILIKDYYSAYIYESTFLKKESILLQDQNGEIILDFTNSSNSVFLANGWSEVESGNGTWGTGEKSLLYLNFNDRNERILKLMIKPLPHQELIQTIDIFLNGFKIGQIKLETLDFSEYFITLKVENEKIGLNTLEFKYNYNFSPKELGINIDTRKLAVLYRNMEISNLNN